MCVPKTLLFALASHDDDGVNRRLVETLEHLHQEYAAAAWCHEFALVLTGGTYDRVFHGLADPEDKTKLKVHPVGLHTREWLHQTLGVLRLPSAADGGLILLGALVSSGTVRLLMPFLTAKTLHWMRPESFALLRLCDYCKASTFLNPASAKEWFRLRAPTGDRNPRPWPLTIELAGTNSQVAVVPQQDTHDGSTVQFWSVGNPAPQERPLPRFPTEPAERPVIALIAHNEMKPQMSEFVWDMRGKLRDNFGKILCTGTTGRVVVDAAPSLEPLVHRYPSGPKGGDVEIAAEILFGRCDVVVFFVDPLHPHPHTDDIHVVFGAAMEQPYVRMFSNERQARGWFADALT